MGLGVVKEHRLTLMEESMRGVGKNGVRWNGSQYDKDGNIDYNYVNGKKIKQ